jgi:hypothetical protein
VILSQGENAGDCDKIETKEEVDQKIPLEKVATMNAQNTLLQKCRENLEKLPQIQQAKIAPDYLITESGRIDGFITIDTPQKSVKYAYKIIPNLTGTTAELAITYCQTIEKNLGQKLILLSRYLSNPIIDRFLQNNIEFIDTAGNIYLNSQAVYILIRGQKRSKVNFSPRSKITTTTLKLIYILLKNPNILQASYQEIAEVSGISQRTVNRTLQNLYELGYLQRQRDGNYWITNYIKLLERWEMGYAENLRPQLLLENFTPAAGRSFYDVIETLIERAKEDNFLIGGEMGASLATSYLRPQSVTLHLLGKDETIAVNKQRAISIAMKCKLKPSPTGEITFLLQFGTQNAWSDYPEPLADPLLLGAELLLSQDDRLRETRDRLYINYIAERQNYA